MNNNNVIKYFRCDDGYYGNPLELGGGCKFCDCKGGPCHNITGQCLECKGNTEGLRCETCKPLHYGNPLESDCKRKWMKIKFMLIFLSF